MKRRKLSKECAECKKRKPLRCFYPSSKCRECTAVDTEKFREAKRNKVV